MSDLMVKLTPELSSKLMGGRSGETDEVSRIVDAFGATLVAPTAAVGESAQYFRVEGWTPADVDDLRDALERLDDVEAAYLKPSDDLP